MNVPTILFVVELLLALAVFGYLQGYLRERFRFMVPVPGGRLALPATVIVAVVVGVGAAGALRYSESLALVLGALALAGACGFVHAVLVGRGARAAGVALVLPSPPLDVAVVALRTFTALLTDTAYAALSVRLFGDYDEKPPHACTRPGILTVDQGKVLIAVATRAQPSTLLDRVLVGGDLEITPTQAEQLIQVLPPEMMAPLMQALQFREQLRERDVAR